jgi:hypothetical protein
MDLAKLIERAKGICLSPKAEWPKIAAETTDVKSLYVGYAAILALIPAICGFIGMTVIGVSMPIVGTIRTPIAAGLAQLIIGYVLGLGVIYLVGMIVNALAPTFSGEKSDPGAEAGDLLIDAGVDCRRAFTDPDARRLDYHRRAVRSLSSLHWPAGTDEEP